MDILCCVVLRLTDYCYNSAIAKFIGKYYVMLILAPPSADYTWCCQREDIAYSLTGVAKFSTMPKKMRQLQSLNHFHILKK